MHTTSGKTDNIQLILFIAMAVVIAVMFVQLQIVNSKLNQAIAGSPTGQVVAPSPQQARAPVLVQSEGSPFEGNPDATVTVVEFSDYQCPFCGTFYTETFPQIKKEYIDTGKILFVHRNFPLSFHEHAEKAAEAANCAFSQDKFWEYIDILYTHQDKLTVADLNSYAAELSLDTEAFATCLDSGSMQASVKKDQTEGSSYGVKGTPAFFVNGKLISGAQPFANFKKIIEEELSR